MPGIGERLTDSRGTTYIVRAELGTGGQGRALRVEECSRGTGYVAKVVLPMQASDTARMHAERLVALDLSRCSKTLLAPSRRLENHVGHLTRESESATTLAFALRTARWPLAEALGIAAQIAAAVAALESREVVHGDIASENVLLSRVRHGCPRAYLIDFDGARGAGLPDTGIIGHTPYLAPELARGDRAPTLESDRFALAVLLYDILLLRHPFIEPGAAIDPEDYRETLARGAVWREDPKVGASPPGLLPVGRLSTRLVSLFRHAFSDPSARPSAATWFSSLVAAMRSIFVCTSCGSEFVNDSERSTCPACGYTRPTFELEVVGGRRIEMTAPITMLGRANFDGDPFVSEKHLRVIRVGVSTLVEDLGSTNGTHILLAGAWHRLPDGQRLVLTPGLTLRVGRVNVRVLLQPCWP